METLLLKSVRIFDRIGPHHGNVCDVLIRNGRIENIADQIPTQNDMMIWESPNGAISSGWIDGQVDFKDPGEEQKEGIQNGLNAALQGGIAHVVLNASNEPAADHKSAIGYLLDQGATSVCQVHPLGCISAGTKGGQLAELYDLAEAGAVGFSDDCPIDRTEMLRRALEYATELNLPIITCPLDLGLNAGAVMHEGIISTQMGVTGNPTSSEVMRIQRDLEVLRYTGGRLHFSVVSSAEGVQLIRQAKSEGLQVTCGTTAHHLYFTDEDLSGFDGTLRVMPPFRSEKARKALCEGVLDGTIDMLVSDHRPEDLEHADVEFALATEGMSGIESLFAVALSALSQHTTPEIARESIIRSLTEGPRNVFGWESLPMDIGSPADLTWFTTDAEWECSEVSKGHNQANYASLLNKPPLYGNPLGVVTSKGHFSRF